jgi:hypothetical protein
LTAHQAACPDCKYRITAHTQVSGRVKRRGPMANDVVVCPGCAAFLWYTEDLSLRVMTLDEVAKLSDDNRIAMIRMRKVVKEMRATGTET